MAARCCVHGPSTSEASIQLDRIWAAWGSNRFFMGFLLVAPSQTFEFRPVAGFVVSKRAICIVTPGVALHVQMFEIYERRRRCFQVKMLHTFPHFSVYFFLNTIINQFENV